VRRDGQQSIRATTGAPFHSARSASVRQISLASERHPMRARCSGRADVASAVGRNLDAADPVAYAHVAPVRRVKVPAAGAVSTPLTAIETSRWPG